MDTADTTPHAEPAAESVPALLLELGRLLGEEKYLVELIISVDEPDPDEEDGEDNLHNLVDLVNNGISEVSGRLYAALRAGGTVTLPELPDPAALVTEKVTVTGRFALVSEPGRRVSTPVGVLIETGVFADALTRTYQRGAVNLGRVVRVTEDDGTVLDTLDWTVALTMPEWIGFAKRCDIDLDRAGVPMWFLRALGGTVFGGEVTPAGASSRLRPVALGVDLDTPVTRRR